MCSFEHYSREYTLQEEGKSPSHSRVRFIKNSGRLLFGKEKPKEIFERYESLWNSVPTQHKPLLCGFKIRKVKTAGKSSYPGERYENFMKTE